MLGLEFFTEIMVVGFLFSAAIVPVFAPRSISAFVPDDYAWITKSKPALAAVAVILVYTVGVAGNRISSGVFNLIPGESEEAISREYKQWAVSRPEMPSRLKLAEFKVRTQSDGMALWSERRRSYIRILRGLTTSLLVHLIAVTYRCVRRRGKYSWASISGVLIAILASYGIYFGEARSYWRLIAQLSRMLSSE
ncbi:MAG TPA: hypothetical protein VN494_00245 [Patescibacteria group bacterium]|nr:hypothetical protein [Patescibacteria group bacterium]